MKVLHVLRQLNRGGIECWLERLLAAWPREHRPAFHLALEEQDFGSLAPRLQALGATLHYCPPPRQAARAASSLMGLLADHGPFSVMHCHNHHASVFNLGLAAQMGVPLRISQAHADFRSRQAGDSIARRCYLQAARIALRAIANGKLAVSAGAAADLFGAAATQAERLPCGIDFQPYFDSTAQPDSSRFTLIHVGRFVPEKNHSFLLDLTAALVAKEPETQLWLVGDGPLRSSLEEQASRLGIANRIHFWGSRGEVADLLKAADVFVFPSFSEGLGLAAIEAQAAGLPVVLASHLPAELDVFPQLCQRLALDVPLEQWVRSILNSRELKRIEDSCRLSKLSQSEFSIHANVHALRRIYAS
ncbi:glycosyltransferase [Bryobacter aggregatus]|uniref:glycosyltransferase n=1 Tax=Bryobacter aggregatus TaxID=360054 RepID=UPI0004E2031E|nr:glycosyltransferase [Bryobacter aggregatus]